VEFALALPLVLILALAILQVGLLVKDQLVIEGSARAGARQGAVSREDADVIRAVKEAAVGLDPSRLEVRIDREQGAGSSVAVRIVYRAPVVVPLVAWLFPDVVDLGAKAIMRQETE
jgi:Flp pilus assembly protein TadG